jgi:uncharacterized membrane protein
MHKPTLTAGLYSGRFEPAKRAQISSADRAMKIQIIEKEIECLSSNKGLYDKLTTLKVAFALYKADEALEKAMKSSLAHIRGIA